MPKGGALVAGRFLELTQYSTYEGWVGSYVFSVYLFWGEVPGKLVGLGKQIADLAYDRGCTRSKRPSCSYSA